MQRITVAFTIFLFIWFAIEAFAQPMHAGEPTQPKAKPTIAVTTFENLSAYPANGWVAMSFSEALTAKLKRLYERFIIVERLRVYEVIREQGFDPEKMDSLEAAPNRLYTIRPKPKTVLPEQERYTSLLGIGTALVALGRYEDAIPKLKGALELRADLKEAVWHSAVGNA